MATPPLTLSGLSPFVCFLAAALPPMPFPPCVPLPLPLPLVFPLAFGLLLPVTLIFRVSPVLQAKEIYRIDEEHALDKNSQNRNQTVFIILLDCGGWLTPFVKERES